MIEYDAALPQDLQLLVVYNVYPYTDIGLGAKLQHHILARAATKDDLKSYEKHQPSYGQMEIKNGMNK